MEDGSRRAVLMTLFVCGLQMIRSWALRWDWIHWEWWILTRLLCQTCSAYVLSINRNRGSGAAGRFSEQGPSAGARCNCDAGGISRHD